MCELSGRRLKHFMKNLKFSFFPLKSLVCDQIRSCHKTGQNQPKVMMYVNHDGPETPMLHTTDATYHRCYIPQMLHTTDATYHRCYIPQMLHTTDATYHRCYIPSLVELCPLVPEMKICWGFYHIWAWRPSWSCDIYTNFGSLFLRIRNMKLSFD